jgi:[glutamine synthetase] adenylyltransferase / [glutamine synthetase]-adenylyl-L-tyrosine phosphorylase
MKITIPPALLEAIDEKWNDFTLSLCSHDLTLPDDETIRESIKTVFCLSEFVFKNCALSPGILIGLIQSRDLVNTYEPGDYHKKLSRHLAGCTDDKFLGQQLALFRQREMVRIAFRDLAGWADLPEILDDLSEFAGACVENALDHLYLWQCRQMGTPTDPEGNKLGLVVIGMGKLGAGELNFSSDIDLVFAYPESGETKGSEKPVTNDVFFLSLARRLIRTIGASGSGKGVFRVDMRLRPFGENGPLVMSFDGMEDYYEAQGREWERYAWLRARVIAGDKTAGKKLLKRLSPFIYRRYLDYTVFDALRDMKRKITLGVKRRDMADNIKLGPGGIREIEFFCQMFQILRGGVTPVLRERHTRRLLSVLKDEGIINRQTHDDLFFAYDFLRNTEHHLQEFSDMQTHVIPKDDKGRLQMAFSMGCETYEAFAALLARHRNKVHLHFNQLLETEDAGDIESDLDDVWQDLSDHDTAKAAIAECGFTKPEKVINSLAYLKDAPETRALSLTGKKRIDRLIPRLIRTVGPCEQAEAVLNRLVDLIKSIERRTNYIALLLENPPVLTHLVRLAEKSPWIITFLARHPVLLDEFVDPRSLYSPPGKSDLKKELSNQMKRLSDDDLEYQIETLCIFKQTNILRVAAADVSGGVPIMRVSDHLTEIGETVLEEVLNLAWTFLAGKHGIPDCELLDHACNTGFLIVGYGKLGGSELGYNSDLDLVFLHAETGQATRDTENPIATPHFYSRLGQRIVHLLTAHTRAGRLYETDMRLRPSGSAGPLVSQIEAFFTYQMEQGWTWEKQALVRARPVSGDPALARKFEEIRTKVLACERDEARLREDVATMREKMRKERLHAAPGEFDLKESPGGIIDIEFLVQYLVLLKSHEHAELLKWTDNVRLLETLLKHNIIDDNAAKILHEGYLTFRTAIHRHSLAEKPARVPPDEFCTLSNRVNDVWNHYLGH